MQLSFTPDAVSCVAVPRGSRAVRMYPYPRVLAGRVQTSRVQAGYGYGLLSYGCEQLYPHF